jgi:hypothetical protein
MTDWALAVTAPNLENAVSAEMARRSLAHILFKVRSLSVTRGRVFERLRPAFPGYVFVRHADYYDVIAIDRVSYVVPKNLPPEVVPDGIVGALVQRCDGGDVFPTVDIPARFKRGDRVTVGGSGALAGFYGVFDRLLNRGRAIVFVPWLGGVAPAEIDESDLVLVNVSCVKKRKRGKRGRRRRS